MEPLLLNESPQENIKKFIDVYLPPISYGLAPLFVSQPMLGVAFYTAVSFLGMRMHSNISDIERVVEFIKTNSSLFSENLVATEEFKKIFICYLDTFMKLRSDTKRNIANRILLGYVTEQEKVNFEIERINNTLLLISPSAIEHLVFLHTTIIPLKVSFCAKQLEENSKTREGTDEWWLEYYDRATPDSKIIQEYMYQNYNINSEKVKKSKPIKMSETDFRTKQGEVEKTENDKIREQADELISLNIYRSLAGTYGGGYTRTEFGKKFISYIF